MGIEEIYRQSNEASGTPDYALLKILGFRLIEITGQTIRVGSRKATLVEMHMIKGWFAQRKCEMFMKQHKPLDAPTGETLTT